MTFSFWVDYLFTSTFTPREKIILASTPVHNGVLIIISALVLYRLLKLFKGVLIGSSKVDSGFIIHQL